MAVVVAAATTTTEPLYSTKTTDTDTAITDWRMSTMRPATVTPIGRAPVDRYRPGPTVTSRAARAWSGRLSVTPIQGYAHITHPRPPSAGTASTAPDQFFDWPIFLHATGCCGRCTARAEIFRRRHRLRRVRNDSRVVSVRYKRSASPFSPTCQFFFRITSRHHVDGLHSVHRCFEWFFTDFHRQDRFRSARLHFWSIENRIFVVIDGEHIKNTLSK